MGKFWRIAAPRGQPQRALCLTTFTRTLDGRRYTFGVLVVGNHLSLTEAKTGRKMRALDNEPWGSLEELREQGVAVFRIAVRDYGEKGLADYFDALAADPLSWKRAAPVKITPPPRIDRKTEGEANHG